MKKIGIVAEYNPFHNGHLYQINEIKKRFGEDVLIVVVISGDFVQRGEMSYLDKWEKTEIILDLGVDLVIELPLYYSIQNAEVFSKMATKILDFMNVDIQVFGAEEENLKIFYDIINLQKNQKYNESLLEKIKCGNNYIEAQKKMLIENGFNDFLKSNNVLGLEYIRVMNEENLKIKPYIIKREISQYNEIEIEKNREKITSATYIREIVKKDKIDNIKKFIPEKTYEIIKNKFEKIDIKNEIYKIVKYKIMTSEKSEIIKIYDMTEQIYDRIYNIISKSENYNIFIQNIKSRNISLKRIDRLFLNILLNIKKDELNFDIDYVRILGFNEKGQKYIKELKKNEENNEKKLNENPKYSKIFVNWKDIEKNIKNNKIKIEKNGFLLKQLFFNKNEKLNPIVKK